MIQPLPRSILPLGDGAVYVEFSETLDLEINAAVQRLALVVRGRTVPWITDIVPALGGLALHFDINQADAPAEPLAAIQQLVSECLELSANLAESPARLLEVPVCYEPPFALDLMEVAGRVGLPPDEVVRRHCAAEYRVLMMGFVPGHPYLGGLDPLLTVPRRESPRPKVPPGSIAIANAQSVIYPFDTPGGWSILGRTPIRIFDAGREVPCLFAPRDRIRFVGIKAAEFERLAQVA